MAIFWWLGGVPEKSQRVLAARHHTSQWCVAAVELMRGSDNHDQADNGGPYCKCWTDRIERCCSEFGFAGRLHFLSPVCHPSGCTPDVGSDPTALSDGDHYRGKKSGGRRSRRNKLSAGRLGGCGSLWGRYLANRAGGHPNSGGSGGCAP